MIVFCVVNFYSTILNVDKNLTASFVLLGISNPCLFCLVEGHMLYRLKEEVAKKAEAERSYKSMYLSEIRFSTIQV